MADPNQQRPPHPPAGQHPPLGVLVSEIRVYPEEPALAFFSAAPIAVRVGSGNYMAPGVPVHGGQPEEPPPSPPPPSSPSSTVISRLPSTESEEETHGDDEGNISIETDPSENVSSRSSRISHRPSSSPLRGPFIPAYGTSRLRRTARKSVLPTRPQLRIRDRPDRTS